MDTNKVAGYWLEDGTCRITIGPEWLPDTCAAAELWIRENGAGTVGYAVMIWWDTEGRMGWLIPTTDVLTDCLDQLPPLTRMAVQKIYGLNYWGQDDVTLTEKRRLVALRFFELYSKKMPVAPGVLTKMERARDRRR